MRVKVPKNFIPCAARMLCERISDVHSDWIHIPDSVKETSPVFMVIEKGRTCCDDQIQPGTYVYTGKFAPAHIGFPGKTEWYVINEADVLGVVTEFVKEVETDTGPTKRAKKLTAQAPAARRMR